MKSLLQQDQECYICHTTQNLHLHHIFAGCDRNNSDKYKLVCYLCAEHHIGSRGVHNNKKIDYKLKQIAQELFEEYYKPNGRKFFMSVFKKNYLEGEVDEKINTCNVD